MPLAWDFQFIPDIAGGKESACNRTTGIAKTQRYLAACSGYAINNIVSLVVEKAVLYRHFCNNQFLCVLLEYPHPGYRFLHFDKTFIHGKRAYSRRDVTTVSLIINNRPVDGNLTKVVIHIIFGIIRPADNCYLAGGGKRSSHAVDLPPVWVRAPVSCENYPVPNLRVFWEVVIMEKHRLTCTTTHKNSRNSPLHAQASKMYL